MFSQSQKKPRLGDGSLGIDVGSRVTKMVLAHQRSDRIEVDAAVAFDIPAGMIENGIVVDRRGFGKVLAAQLAKYQCHAPEGVFSIPSNMATLRWVSLPDLPPDELREAARFKVKKHLPFPVSSAYVEASPPVLTEDGVGQSLVIAVPREVVESRAEALSAAGVEPVRAELEAQAILRIVERRLNHQSALWRDASLTIIDVGGSNTHMYVVQNQRLQFIRGVRFGSGLFVKAVAAALELGFDEAEQLIGRQDTFLARDGKLCLPLGEDTAIVDITADLEKLTREFLRLLRYFRSLHPERSYAGILDHLIVCGGLVGLQGFAEYLEQYLGLRVERARPIAGMMAKFSPETFQSIASRQEAFTVVMGLALSGISRQSQILGDQHAGREYVWTRTA